MTFEELIKKAAKHAKDLKDPEYLDMCKQQRKDKREQLRQERIKTKIEMENSSYIQYNQFVSLNDDLKEIFDRMAQQSSEINDIEVKMIDIERKKS